MESQAKYDVCLSFAGEQRSTVEELADLLTSRGLRVFYDAYEKADLWGKNLFDHFDRIYRLQAKFCVLFASREYATKMWTNHERRSAQARAMSQNREYILPVRVDDTEIAGILETVAFLDLRTTSIEQLADLIEQKVLNLTPTLKPPDSLAQQRSDTGSLRELKRSLASPERRFDVVDLVSAEVGAVVGLINDRDRHPLAHTDYHEQLELYFEDSKRLLKLLSFGAYYEPVAFQELWIKSLSRLINARNPFTGAFQDELEALRHYPALLSLCAMGIASVIGHNEGLLAQLFLRPKYQGQWSGATPSPAVVTLNPARVLGDREVLLRSKRFDGTRWLYPASRILRMQCLELVPLLNEDEDTYSHAWDRFECLATLVCLDIRNGLGGWVGEYMGELRWTQEGHLPLLEIQRGLAEQGAAWPLLSGGAFSGEVDRARAVVASLRAWIKENAPF